MAALIPALNPPPDLADVVASLAGEAFAAVVVVDDGSAGAYRERFEQVARLPGVTVLRHAANQGKGAALRTGLRHVLGAHPGGVGVVTADADGQHRPPDIRNVADALCADPEALVLGVRRFGPRVPLRSRIGNRLTRFLFRRFTGLDVSDTQTGLRGIPMGFIPHLLELSGAGYEFELEMLIACGNTGRRVREVPIRTVYEPGNPTSYFRPFADSLRIYRVLFRNPRRRRRGTPRLD